MSSLKQVSIFGPGLMGASLCMALRERQPDIRIKLWARNRDRLNTAEQANLADAYSINPAEMAATSDLIILCLPVSCMKSVVEDALEGVSPKTIITDVGSVKESVHRDLAPLIRETALWCGSHPMTGSERSGLEAARADLYQDCTTILTPDEETEASTVQVLEQFWQSLGSQVLIAPPGEHDAAVAAVSHLPHLIASLLVRTVEDKALPYHGPGFRDTTRIAAGSPTLWKEILLENHAALTTSLDRFIDELGTARDILRAEDPDRLQEFLCRAAEKRQSLP